MHVLRICLHLQWLNLIRKFAYLHEIRIFLGRHYFAIFKVSINYIESWCIEVKRSNKPFLFPNLFFIWRNLQFSVQQFSSSHNENYFTLTRFCLSLAIRVRLFCKITPGGSSFHIWYYFLAPFRFVFQRVFSVKMCYLAPNNYSLILYGFTNSSKTCILPLVIIHERVKSH